MHEPDAQVALECPEVRFARCGRLNLAYQRFGEGPDVVLVPPLVSNVELQWDNEVWRRALELMSRHVRALVFDKRGIGLSDRFEQQPTLEERVADIVAVMDVEGLARAHVMGFSEGGLMAQLFAAMHFERVSSLTLINSLVSRSAWKEVARYADEPLPTGRQVRAQYARLVESWGREPRYMLDWFLPSQTGNESLIRWLGRFQRQSATSADFSRQVESVMALDATGHLAKIRAPTLIIQVIGDRVVHSSAGRYLAANIHGAKHIEIDGDDHFWWAMPTWRRVIDPWIEFVTGRPPQAEPADASQRVRSSDRVGNEPTEQLRSDKLASLAELVAGISHDINTPLGALQSSADVGARAWSALSEALADADLAGALAKHPKLARAMQAVERSQSVTPEAIQRILRVVRDLQTFAHLDRSEHAIADLHDGLDATLALLAHQLEGRIQVVRRYGSVPAIFCRPEQVNRAFYNILENAVQAIDGPGTIHLTTREDGDAVCVTIEDSGHGVSADDLARIFDPGFTTRGVGIGTGLGLSISHRIVSEHGGHIAVASEPGRGASFTVRLPKTRSSSRARGPQPNSRHLSLDRRRR